MHKAIRLASAALGVLATPALAQTGSVAQAPVATGPVSDALEIDAARQGVLIFEPAFFADQRPNTALDMINRLPGFSLSTGDSSTRGLAGATGNVLINGQRPSSKSDSVDDVLRRIPAAGVERVELIRGGAPGIDMQGAAVVANVVLVRTVTVERVIEGGLYAYPDGYLGPTLGASYSRREGDDQIEGAISATINDRTDGTATGFRRRYSPTGALIQNADLDLWDEYRNVRATGVIQRGLAGGRLRINGVLGWFGNDNTQDLLIRTGPGTDNFNRETSEEIEGELGLTWTRDLDTRSAFELTALQRWGEEDYRGDTLSAGEESVFSSSSTSGESIVRGVLRHRPSDPWAIETGGEVAYNALDSTNAYEENGVAVPLPSASVKVEELRGEIFGQTTWRPDPTLTLEFGIRVEVSGISQSGDSDRSKSFVYPKPRVQATWTPWAGHQFRVRAEREVGQLDFDDFVASTDIEVGQVEGGNPDLEPDKTTLIEALYERRFWDEGVVDATVQHARVEDVVDLIPLAGGFDGVGNIGDGSFSTLRLRLTLPLDRLGLSGARLFGRTTWARSEVTDPLTGDKRRFDGDQAFGCELNFNQDLAGGKWSWGFEHGCNVDKGRAFRVREVRAFHEEPIMEAFVQWKPSDDLTLRLDVGNVTDRDQGYDRFIYAGPRDVSPVAFTETRRTNASRWVYLQARKTF
ncbi:TonB-dependent receptor [Brevundimonas kwangchunensis]|uniref:TonB-dependent receptor n=1 Tax=Brevundimonas kwangchunensis TaxID=322163 RepID=A0ABN1GR92_9CAUL